MRRRVATAVTAAALVLLAACGDDEPTAADDPSTPASETSASEPPELPDWPSCDEVWVAETTLPQGYKGCLDGDTPVKADRQACSSGQVIVIYDDRFYAVLGGPVNETEGLKQDPHYRSARQSCLA